MTPEKLSEANRINEQIKIKQDYLDRMNNILNPTSISFHQEPTMWCTEQRENIDDASFAKDNWNNAIKLLESEIAGLQKQFEEL